jgi:hypothetical protein
MSDLLYYLLTFTIVGSVHIPVVPQKQFAAARHSAAADDPRAAAANFVALVLAWNTPFYPLYLLGIAGAAIRSARG